MNKNIAKAVLLGLVMCSLSSCTLFCKNNKQDYGILKSAVLFSSDKVIGEYGEQIPDNFDDSRFIDLVGDKIPEDYSHALKSYKLYIESHGWYYLLKVFDHNALILFDYSCTTEIDGPVMDSPGMYDLNDLGKYDGCK